MEEESNVTSSSPSTPVQRLRHRKRSSTEVLDGDKVNASPLLVNDRNKYKSFMIRTYSTLWMIAGFVMVVYMGHLYITAMVLVIQIFMAKELFNLLRKAPEDKCLPGIKQLNWHFFFTAMLFVYGRILSQRLANTVTADQFLYRLVTGLIKYHMAICYFLYIIGFMWFILTLKKKMYKYQFGQYAWTHMILIVVFTQSSFTVANIFEGIFWFLLPASLIIINDIFAYIFGFFFGRTPLIKLSPKKTWEGFIGASVTTIISAFVLANVLGRFPWLTCPRQDLSTGWLQCDADPLFKPEPFTLPAWIPGWFPWKEMEVLPVQWHALCLGLFASIIAPFGGFFASGFKRAFKIKDFGDSIPGHGGITDRMDCQVMKLWKLLRSKKVVSIEMVLVDATGTRIHASIDEDLIQIYEGKVFEGDAFFISNFTLVNYATEYRTNPFPYKLTFYRTTNITPCDDFPSYLPNKYLKNFSEIHSGIFKNDVLIDVVGQIVHVGALTEIYAKGKQTNKLNVILRDETASNLTCTLWGDYGKQVIDYVEENNNSIVVCVVRFACVTEYKGVHGISNVFNATQLIFDPPGPHFDDFRSKLPKDDIILSRDDGLSGSTVSWHDELFTKNPRKTLREILRTSEIGKYVTTATVKSVETNPRWYYVVCAVCEKTVHPIEENPGDEEGPVMFDCLQCNRNVTEVLAKFKLVLLVTDDSTEEAKFLIFDNIAYPNFLNKTADELAEEVAEDDDSVLPRTLNDLIGKTLLFKMGVTSKNLKSRKSTFIVDIVTDDEVIIEQFLTQNLSKDATISYADDASQCSIMKNGNNKRLGVMDDGVVNKRRH